MYKASPLNSIGDVLRTLHKTYPQHPLLLPTRHDRNCTNFAFAEAWDGVGGWFVGEFHGDKFHGDTPRRHFPGRILPLRWQKLTLDVEGSSRKI